MTAADRRAFGVGAVKIRFAQPAGGLEQKACAQNVMRARGVV